MGTVYPGQRREEADILLPHIHFRARIQIDIFYHLSVGQFLASLEENIIYDSNNNDCYLAGQQSNCQFGKSTLRQKVWKFTVDNLTNGPSTGHPWCADIIKPDNITPISSAPIICGNNTILSGILTQHLDIYSPHSPHCKH